MITNLKIKNFTLIDTLDIDFKRGFSVITGETGAGKSIILGALSMLLGQRAEAKNIKQGEQRCIVEAHFDLSGYALESFFKDNDLDYDATDCILRREVTAAGKSRAFINDTPVSLSLIKQLGENLVDIHSQHQNLLLRDSNFQLSVVDIIANNKTDKEKYVSAYKEYVKAERQLAEMQQKMTSDRTQEEFLRFQLQELTEAQLDNPDEQTDLEQQAEIMEHTEDIKSALYEAESLLSQDENSIISRLRQVRNLTQNIQGVFPTIEETAERISSSFIELEDISSEINSLLNKVDYDPRELEQINDRLDTIYSLQRKHRCDTIESLIEIRDTISSQLNLIDNSDEAIEEQRKIVEQTHDKAIKLAAILTKQRTKAAKVVESEMKKMLIPLGIPKVQFEVSITPSTLSLHGSDDVKFLFSANTSTSLQPVADVASGGEIARVMLSLKAMISNAVTMPTIIFDEIDTGVSGKIAEAMALIMRDMGENGRQVISITHLPQIASKGAFHYKVQKKETKNGTETNMSSLTQEQRIQEIAQMLSGSEITSTAIAQAQELLR